MFHRDKRYPLTFRDKQRYKLHSEVFQKPPQTEINLENTPLKVRPIVFDLARNHMAINTKPSHWTTKRNLKNIIATGALCGYEILKGSDIPFDRTSIGPGDFSKGDGKVICLSTALVDTLVLTGEEQNKLRSDLVRLTFDLNYVKPAGKYKQFFKLCDLFGLAFTYTIKITADLTVIFSIPPGMGKYINCIFIFKEKRYSLNLTYLVGEIFYGDHLAINLFCLTVLFNALAKSEDKDLYPEFMDYLSSLTEEEIKKILVIFAQGLTFSSEYNFNCVLSLTEGLISEIYFLDTNEISTKPNLPNNLDLLPKTKASSKPLIELGTNNLLYLYGIPIDYKDRIVRALYMDYSQKTFANYNVYFETRPMFLGNQYTTFKFFHHPQHYLTKDLLEDLRDLLLKEKRTDDWELIQAQYNLLKKGYAKTDFFTVLYETVSKKYITNVDLQLYKEIITFFIKTGIDINQYDSATNLTLLQAAAKNGCVTFVRALLELGADPLLTTADLVEAKDDFEVFMQILRDSQKATEQQWKDAYHEEQTYQAKRPHNCLIM